MNANPCFVCGGLFVNAALSRDSSIHMEYLGSASTLTLSLSIHLRSADILGMTTRVLSEALD